MCATKDIPPVTFTQRTDTDQYQQSYIFLCRSYVFDRKVKIALLSNTHLSRAHKELANTNNKPLHSNHGRIAAAILSSQCLCANHRPALTAPCGHFLRGVGLRFGCGTLPWPNYHHNLNALAPAESFISRQFPRTSFGHWRKFKPLHLEYDYVN